MRPPIVAVTLAVLLPALVALAGCVTDGPSPEPAGSSQDPAGTAGETGTEAGLEGDSSGPSRNASTRSDGGGGSGSSGTFLEAPRWSVGDHWTFSSDAFGSFQLVVTREDGKDWIVDTTHEGVAFREARSDLSFVGPVRKGDLAGSKAGNPVAFFDWPLEEGKTWTTSWGSSEVTVSVERVDDGTAHLVARKEGQVTAEYTYDAEAGTFGSMRVVGGNGTAELTMELTDHGSGFGGTALRWSLSEAFAHEATFGGGPHRQGGSFEVPAGATDIWVRLQADCPSGFLDFGLGPNPAQVVTHGYLNSAPCPRTADVAEAVVEEPGQGTWGYGVHGSSPAGQASYDTTVYVRTLQEVSVGGEG